jgi:hypothetical protein
VRLFFTPVAHDDTIKLRRAAPGSPLLGAGDSLDLSFGGRELFGAGGTDREIVGAIQECRDETR